MRCVSVVFCCVYASLAASDAMAEDAFFPKASSDCGIGCVYALCVAYATGETGPYSEFRANYKAYAKDGVTTEDLAKICRDQGLQARPVQIRDVNGLGSLNERYGVIVLVNKNHFAILDHVSREDISLVVPPNDRIHGKIASFSKSFKGDVLLVSDAEIIFKEESRTWLFPTILIAGFLAVASGFYVWKKKS